jgi:hypothetical protein
MAAIEDMAKSNGLRRYIHEKGRAPKEVDEFDNDVDSEELQQWLTWEAGDASIKLIIQTNVKQGPA